MSVLSRLTACAFVSLAAALCVGLFTATAADKHEHKATPKGGRLLDKTEPHAEFVVEKDRSVTINFYNDEMKPIAKEAAWSDCVCVSMMVATDIPQSSLERNRAIVRQPVHSSGDDGKIIAGNYKARDLPFVNLNRERGGGLPRRSNFNEPAEEFFIIRRLTAEGPARCSRPDVALARDLDEKKPPEGGFEVFTGRRQQSDRSHSPSKTEDASQLSRENVNGA